MKWQPDGPLIPGVQIDIKTAPLYKPNTSLYLFLILMRPTAQKKLP